jgi:hypothetical protein
MAAYFGWKIQGGRLGWREKDMTICGATATWTEMQMVLQNLWILTPGESVLKMATQMRERPADINWVTKSITIGGLIKPNGQRV